MAKPARPRPPARRLGRGACGASPGRPDAPCSTQVSLTPLPFCDVNVIQSPPPNAAAASRPRLTAENTLPAMASRCQVSHSRSTSCTCDSTCVRSASGGRPVAIVPGRWTAALRPTTCPARAATSNQPLTELTKPTTRRDESSDGRRGPNTAREEISRGTWWTRHRARRGGQRWLHPGKRARRQYHGVVGCERLAQAELEGPPSSTTPSE